MTPGSAHPLMLSPGDPLDELSSVERSVRLRAAATAYLSRTFGAPTNGNQWTFNLGIHRTKLGTQQFLLRAYQDANNYVYFSFESDDTLAVVVMHSGVSYTGKTYAAFRDVGLFLDINLRADTTNGTAANRFLLEVNGNTMSFSTTPWPSGTFAANKNTIVHTIGGSSGGGCIDTNIVNPVFVDGSLLSSASFGQNHYRTRQWRPRRRDELLGLAYSAGANSSYCDFRDGSYADAAHLGADVSGKGNHWTPVGVSLLPDYTNDWLLDTPTNCFATLSALTADPTWAPTAGGLDFTYAPTNQCVNGVATFALPQTGRWQFEMTAHVLQTPSSPRFGIMDALAGTLPQSRAGSTGAAFLGYTATEWCVRADGQKMTNNVAAAYGPAMTVGMTVTCVVDRDAGTIEYWFGGVYQGIAFSSISATAVLHAACSVADAPPMSQLSMNFGQQPFAVSQQITNAKRLCTKDWAFPLIEDPATEMNVKARSGTGGSTSVTGYAFPPAIVDIKCRNNADSWNTFDAMRGIGAALHFNSTGQQDVQSDLLTAFNSDGYSLGASAGYNVNQSSRTFVDAAWKGGPDYDLLQAYTTAGNYTYTVPAGVTTLRVLVIGAGGGSGGSGAGGGAGTAGGNSLFDTVTAGGGVGGGAGNGSSGTQGTAGTAGSGGDGGWVGMTGEAGTGSGVTALWGNGYMGYGRSAGHHGWGAGGGSGGTRYAILAVTPGQQFSVTVGAAGNGGSVGAGGAGDPGSAGAVLIFGATWPVNVQGTIPSLALSNTRSGVHLMSWVGSGSNGSVGYTNSNDTPSVVIAKALSGTAAWRVWFSGLAAGYSLQINTTDASTSTPTVYPSAPGALAVNLGAASDVNAAGVAYVGRVYCEREGFSKFGIYTGNNSANGPNVWCGFAVRWLLIKSTSTGGVGYNWTLIDSARQPYNNATTLPAVWTNLPDLESAGWGVDLTSSGFKIVSTTAGLNASGVTFMYWAFADSPLRFASAR